MRRGRVTSTFLAMESTCVSSGTNTLPCIISHSLVHSLHFLPHFLAQSSVKKQKLFDQIRGRQFLQEPTLLINTISSIAEHKIDLSTLTYYGDGARLPLPMCIEIPVEEGLR